MLGQVPHALAVFTQAPATTAGASSFMANFIITTIINSLVFTAGMVYGRWEQRKEQRANATVVKVFRTNKKTVVFRFDSSITRAEAEAVRRSFADSGYDASIS